MQEIVGVDVSHRPKGTVDPLSKELLLLLTKL